MDFIPILGFAGSFTAASLFFPQVLKAAREKKTGDISSSTLYLGMSNGLIWTTYGILKNDPFLYVTNSLLFIAVTMLFALKKKYG